MFRFDAADLQRIAVSSIGALALSTVSVIAAAAPARAEAPATRAEWQARVSQRLDGTQQMHVQRDGRAMVGTAVLDARFDADGRFAGADLARSSGDTTIDRDALAVARTTHYPAMPAAMRGTPRVVSMRIYYGASDRDVARAMARDAAATRYADAGAATRLAR